MFGRRVFGSAAIPRAMYTRLHISSPAQAARMLPVLIPLTSSLSVSAAGNAGLVQSAMKSSPISELAEADPVMLKALLESISPVQLGYLRLLELWGIGRTAVMNKSLGAAQAH